MNASEQALGKAMRFCSTKEVCVFDITQKLSNWDVDEEFHQQIISTLLDEQFIDEQRYANAFASDKFIFNKWGRIKISFFLRKKEIKNSLIQQATEKINFQDYADTIEKLIITKLKSTKEQDFLKLKSKIYRHLVSKGFEVEFFASKLHTLVEEHLKTSE
jgi:regulatory protein